MTKVAEKFNDISRQYFLHRPHYPTKLFSWISSVSKKDARVLDVGTGNGQAAIGLSKLFPSIIAIDRSKNQLKDSILSDKIKYQQMDASQLIFPDNSFDLITSASAAHWFNLDEFYAEAKRVLTTNALIILWTYTYPTAENDSLNDALLQIKAILDPYWSKGSLYHLNQYKTLPFPFDEIATPKITMSVQWSTRDIISFLSSWACIKCYLEEKNKNFLNDATNILNATGTLPDTKHHINFPLYIKAGSV